MGRKAVWKKQLEVSRSEALLAVKLFNDPTDDRPFEHFIVHMQMAYLYLMFADASKRGFEVRLPDKKFEGRFQKTDGEFKTKSLALLVAELHPDAKPLRNNIDFFIGLRNKIEHRAPLSKDASDYFPEIIAGQIQAYLVNYERLLTEVGGLEFSLAQKLRFPLFVGGFTENAKEHLANLTKALPGELRRYVANFNRSLPEEIAADPRYSLTLDVSLTKKQRNGHLNLNFISTDANLFEGPSPSEAYLISRVRTVQVDGAGTFKATEAAKKVAEAIPFAFNTSHFTQSWKLNKVRPPHGSTNPLDTDVEFCTYNQPFGQYAYTQAYIDRLIRECQSEDGFLQCTGRVANRVR